MIGLNDFDVRLANHHTFIGQIELVHQLGHDSSTVQTTPRGSGLRGIIQRFFRPSSSTPLAREEEGRVLAVSGS